MSWNCPKDQYMVVKTASYRGLSMAKTCDLSDDHSCDVDVTCLVTCELVSGATGLARLFAKLVTHVCG